MTAYKNPHVDFIKRTRQLIFQYDEFVMPNRAFDHQHEVTLLLNCLLGLLVYPQQLSYRHGHRLEHWLKEELVLEVSHSWGIDAQTAILNAGYESGRPNAHKITLQELDIPNMIRQMRNSVVHASFEVLSEGEPSVIQNIVFRDTKKADGFHMILHERDLKTFVMKLADSALEQLEIR